MKIAGVIPAKGSSTRVEAKNKQTILGVPLYLWAANNLARVLPRDQIFIDSDDETMLADAASFGFGTIKRPAELATNATDGNQLLAWQAQNVDADIYVQHLPPMAFLKAETLKVGIDAVVSGEYSSAIAAYKEHFYTWGDDGPNYDLLNIPNSFTLPATTVEGMGLYVVTKEAFLAQKVRAADPYKLIEIDRFEAIDIDYPTDLEFARAVAAGLPKDSPYIDGIHGLKGRPNIKLLVLDVDGVMTDGGMYYTETGDQFKKFNSKDGLAIQAAEAAGIETAFLSSGSTQQIIPARAKTLGVKRLHVGREPKLDILTGWLREMGLGWHQVAYIGDDVNDLAVIERCGLTACPANAVDRVKRTTDIVLSQVGGDACVREFVDNHLIGET